MGFKPRVQRCSTPDPALPDSSSRLGLPHFRIAKAAKTALPTSSSARDFPVKIATMFCADQFSTASPPFSPICEQAAQTAKPRKNNLEAQWELALVAFFLWMSRRGWRSRFLCSWGRSVNRPACVLAGLLGHDTRESWANRSRCVAHATFLCQRPESPAACTGPSAVPGPCTHRWLGA